MNNRVAGNGHGNQVNGFRAFGDFAYTCGIDDSLREINIEGNTYTDGTVKLNSQPRGLDIFREQNIVILACQKDITVVQVLNCKSKYKKKFAISN